MRAFNKTYSVDGKYLHAEPRLKPGPYSRNASFAQKTQEHLTTNKSPMKINDSTM